MHCCNSSLFCRRVPPICNNVGGRTLAGRVPQSQMFFTALSAASQGRFVPMVGGILVRDAAGAVIGAVGISGDTSANDEKCGIAGIEAAGLTADPGKHPS